MPTQETTLKGRQLADQEELSGFEKKGCERAQGTPEKNFSVLRGKAVPRRPVGEPKSVLYR
jgi:hypothetical protein